MYVVDTKATKLQFTHMAIAPNVDRDRTITPVTSIMIMYKIQQQIITSDSPVLLPPSKPSTPKVLQVANALKWPYFGRIKSELSDSSCLGFPVGPTIAK